MKHFILDKEEKQLLKEFERGEWKRVKNFEKEKKMLQEAARNTLKRTKRISIRLSEKDLHKLKVKAVQEGILYQTLAASVLHKFVNK